MRYPGAGLHNAFVHMERESLAKRLLLMTFCGENLLLLYSFTESRLIYQKAKDGNINYVPVYHTHTLASRLSNSEKGPGCGKPIKPLMLQNKLAAYSQELHHAYRGVTLPESMPLLASRLPEACDEMKRVPVAEADNDLLASVESVSEVSSRIKSSSGIILKMSSSSLTISHMEGLASVSS